MIPTVSINLDFELLTGWHHLSEAEYRDRRAALSDARDRVVELVDLLAEYGVPTTWNTVGHLMIPSCDGHPDLGPIPNDPEVSAEREPLWYAPDLVEYVIASDAKTEIGSHSFSHAVFTEITTDRARRELAAFEAAIEASRFDLSPVSFVFPQNEEAHHELLADFGFRIYRSHPGRFYRMGSSLPAKCYRAGAIATGRERGGAHRPVVDEYGMLRITESVALSRLGGGGIVDTLGRSPLRSPLVEYVDRTIRTMADGQHLHLWMHPHDFEDRLSEATFRSICETLSVASSDGLVRLCTMAELAELRLDGEPSDRITSP